MKGIRIRNASVDLYWAIFQHNLPYCYVKGEMLHFKYMQKLIWQYSTPNPELIRNMNIVEIENSFFPLIWSSKQSHN